MGFIFPNEANITWTVMIVLYPYITGLVDGAFIVLAMYYVFGREHLKPVARFSMASAFIFLLFAPLPLLIHLGRPDRAFNIMVTPNFSSAMAGFGYLYLVCVLLLALEIWFAMRSDFIERAKGTSFWAFLAKIIMLGNLEENALSKAADRKIVKFLAGLGIPLAVLLHGYVGFLFGSIKANPWWSTPLMFVIFIFSAIVSGIAVIIFHYYVVSWINGWKVDYRCVRSLSKYLWGFMIIAVSLELLELLSIAYKQTEEWEILGRLIEEKLLISYVVLQFLLFALVPFFLLGFNALFKVADKAAGRLAWIASTMLLAQVLLMRWNVVIGGQLLSKSMRGFTSYLPGIFDKEGIIMAVVIFTLPFVILWVFHRFIDLFPDAERREPGGTASIQPT